MATKVETAHAMMVRRPGSRTPASATTSRPGWPSTSPRSTATRWSQDSFRIHGGYGYSKEYEIERLYREAAFLLIGEGTADIQKMIIGRSLLKDYKLKK